MIHVIPTEFVDFAAAIAGSANGDTIVVEPGVYTGANNRNIDPGGIDPLTIMSLKGEHETIIDCENLGRGFVFNAGAQGFSNDVILDGFTIRNGSSVNGGGLYINNSGAGPNPASPTIRNMIIHDCISTGLGGSGGGIYIFSDAHPILENVLIYNCSNTGGGINQGGGISVTQWCHPTFRNVTISNCNAAHGGGLAIHLDCTVTATNCVLWGNAVTGNGNEIYIDDALSILNLNNSCYGNGVNDVVNNGTFNPVNCTTDDPLFRTGPEGVDGPALDYYLTDDSPAINTGLGTSERNRTTRTDLRSDISVVNMGYYVKIPDGLWRRRRGIASHRRLKRA